MTNYASVMRMVFIATYVVIFAGCGQVDISGTYIQHDDSSAVLLQLEQTSDQSVTASWKITSLGKDGVLKTVLFNLDGVIENEKLVFLIPSPDSSTKLINIEGKWKNEMLEMPLPEANIGEKFILRRFIKGTVGDFDAASKKLAMRGEAIVTSSNQLRNEALYQEGRYLSYDLDQFITRGKNYLAGKKEIAKNFFSMGVQYNETRLNKIKNILMIGGSVNKDEVSTIRAEMISNYKNMYQGFSEIEEFQHNEAEQEKNLDQRITEFQSNCFDYKKYATDSETLNVKICKEFGRAASAYQLLLPSLHGDLAEVANVAVASKHRLETIKGEVDKGFGL